MKRRAKVRKKNHVTLSGASYILSKLIIGILPHVLLKTGEKWLGSWNSIRKILYVILIVLI